MKMKISPFLFLAILCFFILPVNAGTILGFSQLHSMGQVVPVSSYSGTRDNIMYVADDNDILMVDNLNGSYNTGKITNFPTDVDGVWGTAEYIYVVLYDGRAYRIDNSAGQRDFSVLDFSSSSPDSRYLGDFTNTNGYANRICADDGGNIYVSDGATGNIFLINPTTLTSVLFFDNPDDYISSAMFPSEDGLYISDRTSSGYNINRCTDVGEYETLFSVSGATYSAPGISQLTNGNIILFIGAAGSPSLSEYYINGTLFGHIEYQSTVLNIDTSNPNNIFVMSNGVVCAGTSSNPANTITTYSSVSGAGGYFSSETGLIAPQLEYSKKEISSEYPTYYNMSSILINWNIAIDENSIGIGNSYATKDQLLNAYDWQFELWSPDGVSISTYKISDSSFKWESSILGIIGTGDLISIGGAKYPNINMNGTWQVRLYERNTIQGTKALLDTYSFEIQDLSNPFGSAEVVPTDTSGESAAYNFLNSPYLVAIIVIGIVGFQFGRGRDGNINGTAMIVLIPLAVGLCCLMGILPMWILYVMVLCIIAFVAVKMSTGGS